MSIQTISNQIKTLNNEIHSIENQIHTIDTSISRKQLDLASIIEKATREKNPTKIAGHIRDQARKAEEITRLEKDKNTKSRSLADKHKRRSALTVQLSKEEQKEHGRAMKEHKELLSIQQEISREKDKQNFMMDSFFAGARAKQIKPTEKTPSYDVFVSHASEDKDEFVRPFANYLRGKGLTVWYDEFELQVGDSLRRSIDKGLANSTFGIVVLSEHFFKKEWPQRELDGMFARETIAGEKIILPIWHKISKNEVMKYSPTIADLVALNTATYTIEEIADKIAIRVRPSDSTNGG